MESRPEIQDQISFISSQINFESNKPRLLFFIPESAGDIFLSTALLPSLREQYHDFDIYYACSKEYFPILEDNPNIDYIIEECPTIGDTLVMEGISKWPGLFDVSIYASILTQLYAQYSHNGMDRIGLNLKKN